jgi:TetR/AcrR family transcriptional regulator
MWRAKKNMSGHRRGRGRTHDAEGAREAILNAAEEVFAEHGFDGARIDAIAETAGYNKSLLFHYYDDKLGLYAAVLKRIDEQTNDLQVRLLEPLLADESFATDADKFRTFLSTVIRMLFDLLVDNPHLLRMFAWEGAEGWQTYKKVASQLNTDDLKLLRHILQQAQEAGLIRPGIDARMVFGIAYATCLSYLINTPILEMFFNDEDFVLSDVHVQARETIVEFVIHGIMGDRKGPT